MSKFGIQRQAERLVRMPDPETRLAAGERLAETLETIVRRQRENAPARDESPSYRAAMIDAGRGRLLR